MTFKVVITKKSIIFLCMTIYGWMTVIFKLNPYYKHKIHKQPSGKVINSFYIKAYNQIAFSASR